MATHIPKDDRPSIPIDATLDPYLQAMRQMRPDTLQTVMNVVRDLAERDGVKVAYGPTPGLQAPREGVLLWKSRLVQEGRSKRTIESYVGTVLAILDQDPVPTRLSIRQYIADRLSAGISPPTR